MPTSRPRYQITDTGPVQEMLDAAQKRWPEVRDRKALLLQLAKERAAQLAAEQEVDELAARRERQVKAHAEILELIDVDVLMSEEAWK